MARLDSLAHQLHAMHQSTSWRVTEPMRQVSTMVSRMRSFARRAPGALARRSAAVVRWRAPGLFRFLVTNAIVRRVYLAVNQPVAAAPVVAVVAQASAPAAAPAPVTALPEIAGPDLYATNTFVSLTHAMQGWNLGRRIDA